MGQKISVIIADDHKLIRDSFQQILNGENSLKIVGEAASWPQTIDIVGNLEPDVVLLDHFLTGIDNGNNIRQLIEKSPETRILITFAVDDTVIVDALKSGAKGYISKNAGISDLIKAIQAVYRGELWIERKLMTKFFDKTEAVVTGGEDRNGTKDDGLTPREREVLHHLVKGATNKEIADSLFISETTVKSHLNNIFRKLNVSHRLEAILYAINRRFT